MDKVDYIDYKKAEVLVQFVQERGKILPRRITALARQRHQRWLTVAIKQAQVSRYCPSPRNCKLRGYRAQNRKTHSRKNIEG